MTRKDLWCKKLSENCWVPCIYCTWNWAIQVAMEYVNGKSEAHCSNVSYKSIRILKSDLCERTTRFGNCFQSVVSLQNAFEMWAEKQNHLKDLHPFLLLEHSWLKSWWLTTPPISGGRKHICSKTHDKTSAPCLCKRCSKAVFSLFGTRVIENLISKNTW